MAKRYVRGDRAFGRLLKMLPDTVSQQLRGQLKISGQQELLQQRAFAPFRTGTTKDALSFRVPPVQLTLKVGLVGKPLNRRIYWAHIVQFGRKGGGRGVKRGSAKFSAGVGKVAARNFIFPPRQAFFAPFKAIWDKALRKAASGISDE